MKKVNLFFVFIILICITILSGCTKMDGTEVVLKSDNSMNADNQWKTILGNGVIKIGIEDVSLPYIEKTTDGTYKGFLVDLSDAIAKKAGIKAEFVEISDNNVNSLLQNNKIDVVMNGYTEADTKNSQIRWLQPYLTNHCIIACNKYSKIESKDDLSGKKVGVVDETLPHITAISDVGINNDELVKFSSEKEALSALAYDKINALIIEDSYFYYYKKINDYKFNILDEIIYTYTRSIGLKKDNTQLYEELQKIYTELGNDGTLEKISKKWFGTNLTK